MGKVIIETKNEKELKLKTSLTSEQVEREFEEKRKAEVVLDKLRGIQINLHKNSLEKFMKKFIVNSNAIIEYYKNKN